MLGRDLKSYSASFGKKHRFMKKQAEDLQLAHLRPPHAPTFILQLLELQAFVFQYFYLEVTKSFSLIP